MAHITIKGIIKYKVKNNHPDLKYIPEEERDKVLVYSDIYNIDTDCFYGRDHIESYIKNDLKLVAGGGYYTDTIKNVKITLNYGAF